MRLILEPSVDIIGKKYNLLTVLSYQHSVENGTHLTHIYSCRCDCGGLADVRHNNIISGNTRSCGCLRRGPRKKREKY